jgi:hypothetical protein
VLHQPCVGPKRALLADGTARKRSVACVCASFRKETSGVEGDGLSDEHDIAVLHTSLASPSCVGENNRGHPAEGGEAHSELQLHASIIFVRVNTTTEAHHASGANGADEKFSSMTRHCRNGHAWDACVVHALLCLNAIRKLAEATAENKSDRCNGTGWDANLFPNNSCSLGQHMVHVIRIGDKRRGAPVSHRSSNSLARISFKMIKLLHCKRANVAHMAGGICDMR